MKLPIALPKWQLDESAHRFTYGFAVLVPSRRDILIEAEENNGWHFSSYFLSRSTTAAVVVGRFRALCRNVATVFQNEEFRIMFFFFADQINFHLVCLVVCWSKAKFLFFKIINNFTYKPRNYCSMQPPFKLLLLLPLKSNIVLLTRYCLAGTTYTLSARMSLAQSATQDHLKRKHVHSHTSQSAFFYWKLDERQFMIESFPTLCNAGGKKELNFVRGQDDIFALFRKHLKEISRISFHQQKKIILLSCWTFFLSWFSPS